MVCGVNSLACVSVCASSSNGWYQVEGSGGDGFLPCVWVSDECCTGQDLGEAPRNWSSRISQMACTCNSLHVILLTSLHLQLTWSPFSPSVQHNICCVLLPQLHLVDKGFFRCNSFWNIGCPLGSVVSTTTGAGGGDGDTLWGRGQGWGHSLGQGPGRGHFLG